MTNLAWEQVHQILWTPDAAYQSNKPENTWFFWLINTLLKVKARPESNKNYLRAFIL